MASTGLVTASVAMVLLIASVGIDLAFDSTVRVEAGVGDGPMQLVGDGALDGRTARSPAPVDPFSANRSDVMTFKITLENGYPWSSSRSFEITFDGCYDGARVLAVVDVSAPARGTASSTTEIAISRLLDESSRFMPKEIGASGTPQYVYLQICRGEQYAAAATIPIAEVAR